MKNIIIESDFQTAIDKYEESLIEYFLGEMLMLKQIISLFDFQLLNVLDSAEYSISVILNFECICLNVKSKV